MRYMIDAIDLEDSQVESQIPSFHLLHNSVQLPTAFIHYIIYLTELTELLTDKVTGHC